MELNQKINIRINSEQLKRLKLAVAREKMTMSEIIRRVLHQYIQDNPKSVISKHNPN
jgi:predicted DNA binding CopG/RHH family protein